MCTEIYIQKLISVLTSINIITLEIVRQLPYSPQKSVYKSDSPTCYPTSVLLYLCCVDWDVTDVTECEILSVKCINTHFEKLL